MKTIHDEEKITAQIVDILSYQQSITSQGVNYRGEKDWALNKIKELVNDIRQKTIDECMACVPEKLIYSEEERPISEIDCLNSCREEFITKLEQLKK